MARKAKLRARGFSAEQIREMTPAHAHVAPAEPSLQEIATGVRCGLKEAGFSPIPCNGKAPGVLDAHGQPVGMQGWQTKIDVSIEQIKAWPANNTGLLTRNTPTLDIDILDEAAAVAVEALARERFGERGRVLVRVGRAPKRAIPFRTDAPFEKLTVPLVAADGSKGQKLEFLGDGQQFVAFGMHPDTGQGYEWLDDEPGTVRHEQLPPISQAEAQTLINDAAELLITRHDYSHRKPEKNPFQEFGAQYGLGGVSIGGQGCQHH